MNKAQILRTVYSANHELMLKASRIDLSEAVKDIDRYARNMQKLTDDHLDP
jgi:hypothetical protein